MWRSLNPAATRLHKNLHRLYLVILYCQYLVVSMILRICIHLIYMNIMNSMVEFTSRLKIFLMEQQYK